MTEAIGTQNTSLLSSVIQALLATSPKFSMPERSFSEARYLLWNNLRDASKGRQVIKSPAVPPSSLVFSTPLYSAGAVGAKTTWIFGYLASKAGMILSVQMARSSLRQLSMVVVTFSAGACVAAAPPQAVKIHERPTSRLINVNDLRIFFSFSFSLAIVHSPNKLPVHLFENTTSFT